MKDLKELKSLKKYEGFERSQIKNEDINRRI